ncbi:MAG: tyrosine recombinase XerC [Ruminococcaceae bacterium]|nr:tyrosine recombinase XerC [Oscillospiraceae bacterium]
MLAKNFKDEASPVIREYLVYLQTIKGKSPKTIEEYFLDLRTFFRFLKIHRGIVSADTPFDEISISDIDLELIRTVTLADAYEFMGYLIDDRQNNSSTRLRKTSALRGFFNYICVKKHYIDEDPLKELETPKQKKSLPKYLTLEQSIQLLEAVDGPHKERDYCIITLFLNCGLRLSELVGLNVSDIRSDRTARVVGKGNKERIIYLNDACINAIEAYLKVRPADGLKDRNALFISNQKKRLSSVSVQKLVYKYLEKIGLDSQGYSCHKLRHTAATLMYQHGNVDIRVLKEILGHENLGTTEIYTHLNSEQMEDAAKSNPLAKIKNNSDNE